MYNVHTTCGGCSYVLDMCLHSERSGGWSRKQTAVDVGQLTKHLLDRVDVTAVDCHHVHGSIH